MYQRFHLPAQATSGLRNWSCHIAFELLELKPMFPQDFCQGARGCWESQDPDPTANERLCVQPPQPHSQKLRSGRMYWERGYSPTVSRYSNRLPSWISWDTKSEPHSARTHLSHVILPRNLWHVSQGSVDSLHQHRAFRQPSLQAPAGKRKIINIIPASTKPILKQLHFSKLPSWSERVSLNFSVYK